MKKQEFMALNDKEPRSIHELLIIMLRNLHPFPNNGFCGVPTKLYMKGLLTNKEWLKLSPYVVVNIEQLGIYNTGNQIKWLEGEIERTKI